MSRSSKTRVIDQLRRLFPGAWHYDRSDFAWVHEDGWRVHAVAVHSPQYDGDDDTFGGRR